MEQARVSLTTLRTWGAWVEAAADELEGTPSGVGELPGRIRDMAVQMRHMAQFQQARSPVLPPEGERGRAAEQVERYESALMGWYALVGGLGLELMALSESDDPEQTRVEWKERAGRFCERLDVVVFELLSLHVMAAVDSSLQSVPPGAELFRTEILEVMVGRVPEIARLWSEAARGSLVEAQRAALPEDDPRLVALLVAAGVDPVALEFGGLSDEGLVDLGTRVLELFDEERDCGKPDLVTLERIAEVHGRMLAEDDRRGGPADDG